MYSAVFSLNLSVPSHLEDPILELDPQFYFGTSGHRELTHSCIWCMCFMKQNLRIMTNSDQITLAQVLD